MRSQYRRTTETAPAGGAPLVICGLGTGDGPTWLGEGDAADAVGEGPDEPPQAASKATAQQATARTVTADGRLMVLTKAPFVAFSPLRLHHSPADVYRMTIVRHPHGSRCRRLRARRFRLVR
jgi:hypothetical protein